MHVETNPFCCLILLTDVTDVILCVYLNFHKINANSRKFYPEKIFKIKGFIRIKSFYNENSEPYGMFLHDSDIIYIVIAIVNMRLNPPQLMSLAYFCKTFCGG